MFKCLFLLMLFLCSEYFVVFFSDSGCFPAFRRRPSSLENCPVRIHSFAASWSFDLVLTKDKILEDNACANDIEYLMIIYIYILILIYIYIYNYIIMIYYMNNDVLI